MYNHPLATYFLPTEETDNEPTCNSWGYVSGLTHAYFEQDNEEAGAILLRLLAQSDSSSPIRHRKLLRSYKKFKTISVLRELQCILVNSAEAEVEEVLSSFNIESFFSQEDGEEEESTF
jgi:hypothetical protein